MMTGAKFDIQKIETLLNSATNERQRKMYLALLNKARAELAPDSNPPQQKATESSHKEPKTSASTKKKAQGKTAKKKAKSYPPASKQTSSKKNATSKKEKSSNNDSIVVTEEISATSKSTSVLQTNQTKENLLESATTKAKAKKQSKKSKSNDKATSSDQPYFSGVGIIKCTPYLDWTLDKGKTICVNITQIKAENNISPISPQKIAEKWVDIKIFWKKLRGF